MWPAIVRGKRQIRARQPAYGENLDDTRRLGRLDALAGAAHAVLRPLADAGLDNAAVRYARFAVRPTCRPGHGPRQLRQLVVLSARSGPITRPSQRSRLPPLFVARR
jgi:hypothetical protein